MQLQCTGTAYCDFVVWSEKSIFIERIHPDHEFWSVNVEKAKQFVLKGILPELLGKWFSRPPKPTQREEGEQFCYCRQEESGQMIACDNDNCPYQWFHFECLQMTAPPKSRKWFCPDCQKEKKNKKVKT